MRLRETLEEAKRAGVPFDEAWDVALARDSAPPDWGADGLRPGPRPEFESPLSFMRRHFEAAYAGTVAARSCQTEDCVQLATVGRRCDRHGRLTSGVQSRRSRVKPQPTRAPG